jgi:PAS domain S-box-containing protein
MAERKTGPAEQIEILIAEDSPTQAAQLEHHLTARGYRVVTARNGREALACALQKKPHLIITDVVMPEMDGFVLCKQVKSQPSLKDVPVILVTSLSGPQDVLQGLECGADNFIRKPYDHHYLLSRVEYILKNLELRKSGSEQSGVQLYFAGKRYFITAEKQQILDLLISTYEGAIQINQDLATKQLELARERDLLHTLMDNVPDFIYFKDVNGRFTTINRALATALNLRRPEDAVGKTSFDYFDVEYAREAREDDAKILASGAPMIAKIERVPRPDGSPMWLSTTKMLTRDLAGSTVGTFGVSRDITEAKLAEEQIRKAKDELEMRVAERTSELAAAYKRLEQELVERERAQRVERETQARFRFLFANNPLPLWVYDSTTLRFLEVNDAAIAHYGYSPEEFAAMRIGELLPGPGPETIDGESKHRLKDGRIIDVNITAHPIEWRGRNAVLVVAQDITEQKRLQREFLQAQKMEAVGALAAGVAHDFNNLLTVVKGYCSLVLEQLTPENPIYEEICEINRAGERAATLSRQLLAFSRKEIFQPKVLNLNDVVGEIDRMLRRMIGADIELVTRLDPALGRAKADPGQMEQIIMNLAVNARDAMPKGGKLIIETSNTAWEGPKAIGHSRLPKPGRYIMLTVTDTGSGMNSETQSRIFEPFFTTKEAGKGTGLGLSTVYGIVEKTGGKILVDSEPGRGTTFKIYLPQTEAVSETIGKTPVPPPARGNETILLVEDEEGIRVLESRVLEKQGYTVLRASNGKEAIQISERHPGKIDLLITDVVMPVMSGSDLAESLMSVRRDLKVLFTSGYTNNSVLPDSITARNAEFLAKPFEGQAFARKVREVLDRKEVAWGNQENPESIHAGNDGQNGQ